MDDDFQARRAAAKERLDRLTGARGGRTDERLAWFETVYASSGGDAAGVPWADLAAKPQLLQWLRDNPGNGATALDVACGLGDNAEALAAAGYATTAFDLAPTAIAWAQQRFPGSPVDYRAADLFDPPPDWRQGFDLVHECYTIQALSGALRERAIETVAGFVRPGGRLLVITRMRPERSEAQGPPCPLTPSELKRFESFGFRPEDRLDYRVTKDTRSIPHCRISFRLGVV